MLKHRGLLGVGSSQQSSVSEKERLELNNDCENLVIQNTRDKGDRPETTPPKIRTFASFSSDFCQHFIQSVTLSGVS